MLFKSLCCEIIMEHKESTSVKIMAISAEVFLTKKRVSLTIPVLKNGINTHPWKVMCVTLCLSGLLVSFPFFVHSLFLIGSDCSRNHVH